MTPRPVPSGASSAGGARGVAVAVTRGASPVGEALLAALAGATSPARGHASGGDIRVSSVVAIDDHRGRALNATWRLADITDPSVAGRLRGIDVVVHIAAPSDLDAQLARPPARRREETLRAAQAVVTAAAAVGARHVIVVTSAMVYGALPDNPVPLPDDAPLRAPADTGLVGDLLEVERLVDRIPSAHPNLRVTVIRPAALVGTGIDTVVTRHFEAPRLLSVRDADTGWQFCHVDDLAEAVVTVVRGQLTGAVTVACDGVMTPEEVERLTGMRRVEVPRALAFGTAERLHRFGVLPMPASDLAYVVHPWSVSSQRLRATGWTPRYDNVTALSAALAQLTGTHAVVGRRVGGRDAAVGATGAAVALVGTAALVRKARRRRQG